MKQIPKIIALLLLVVALCFTYGCTGGASANDGGDEAEAVDTIYYPRIRFYEVWAITEHGRIFYRPNTKAWITGEDELAFVYGDDLRYGGASAMKGLIDAPIIIVKPIPYRFAILAAEEEDYGVSSEQIMPPDEMPIVLSKQVDIRLFSPGGRPLYFFTGEVSEDDIEAFKAGGNLRFRINNEVYLLKAPIVTISQNTDWRYAPIPMDELDGDPLE